MEIDWIEIDDADDDSLPEVGIEVLLRDTIGKLEVNHLVGDTAGNVRWAERCHSITHWLPIPPKPIAENSGDPLANPESEQVIREMEEANSVESI